MNDPNVDQNVFDANQVKKETENPEVLPKVEANPVTLIDKQKIISSDRKFPKNIILILVVVLLLLVAIILLSKLFISSRVTQKQTVITWWSLEEDASAVVPLIHEYEQKNPNVKVQFISQSQQDYQERLVNALAKGNAPDIFEFHNSWLPIVGSNLAPTKDDFSSIFYPVAISDLKTKNGFLGVPLEYDGIALFTNLDILQSFGKNSPKTWDEFRKIASELTIRDAQGNIKQAGAALGVTSNIDYWQDIIALLMLQNGADLTSPSTGGGPSALTFYTNFSKVDRVWDETLPTSKVDFENGQLAMYFGSYKDTFAIRKQNPNLHFAVVPLPQLPTDSPTIPSVSYANYWVNGVSMASSNKTAAWNFLKFMTTQNALRKLYLSEKSVRGYGNLYPRVDMQKELLNDTQAAPFIYQASFAKKWYLNANTYDAPTGINSQ